jgi:hypothetical protein
MKAQAVVFLDDSVLLEGDSQATSTLVIQISDRHLYEKTVIPDYTTGKWHCLETGVNHG